MKRWWFSWYGPRDDYRPIIWPLPEGWLGYWCSGYGDDYSTLVGWVEAESAEAVADMVHEGWDDWDGRWRIEPDETSPGWTPGDRFPQPSWAEGRWS